MMVRTFLTLFILLHLVGDFYAQTNRLSERKKERISALAVHSILYLMVMIAGTALFAPIGLTVCALIVSVAHFVVDLLKYVLRRKVSGYRQEAFFYLSDQIAHLLILVICAVVYVTVVGTIEPRSLLLLLTQLTGADLWKVLSITCLLLLICKPTNITIKHLLAQYRPESADTTTLANAGAYIGLLERILIALLIGLGQYAAIGLVLTAKSIARYDKISKDQRFSEYYLLGTLLSTLLVIAACFAFGIS